MQKDVNEIKFNGDTLADHHVFSETDFAKYTDLSPILKSASPGENVCCFGTQTQKVVELLYRNKIQPGKCIGLCETFDSAEFYTKKWVKLKFAEFRQVDLSYNGTDFTQFSEIQADKVISLVSIAGLTKSQFYYRLQNYFLTGHNEADYFIQLPMQTAELTEAEIQTIIEMYFKVISCYGTPGTLGEYKSNMNTWQKEMYEGLSLYYSCEIVDGFMALFSRTYVRRGCGY